MAQLRLTLLFDPVPTEYVRVVARPRRDLSVIAANVVFAPPHENPRVVSIYVPTPETHQVTIYRTPDEETLGIQGPQYEAMPVYYNSIFLEDIELVVGRGTETDPGDPEIVIDPVAGTTEVAIPFLAGKTVARIFREAAGRYMRKAEYTLTTSLGESGIRLLSPGDTFYADELGGEGFRIEFGPYYENNTGQAIFDLTDMITTHIEDTNNPHEVDAEVVGLGNLPNAITDSYQDNDSNKMASAKAVYDLWQASLNAKIVATRSVFLGNIGAVSVGGDITAVVNAGGYESKVTITHGLGIIGPYMVWPVLVGRSAGTSGGFDNWKIDNDTIAIIGNSMDQNKFDLIVTKPVGGGVTTSITAYYMIIKLS